MSVVAIVPARSGSKRIRNKNLKKIGSVSLVRQAALVGIHTSTIEKVILDTDSKRIAKECENLRILIAPLRPTFLSNDFTSSVDSVLFLLDSLKDLIKKDDVIVLLQPTNPFRTVQLVESAINLFLRNNKKYSVIASSVPLFAIKDFFIANKQNRIIENLSKRNSTQENIIYDTGAVYVTSPKLLLKERSFVPLNKTLSIDISPILGFDVDTKLDLKIARFLYSSGDAVLQKF